MAEGAKHLDDTYFSKSHIRLQWKIEEIQKNAKNKIQGTPNPQIAVSLSECQFP